MTITNVLLGISVFVVLNIAILGLSEMISFAKYGEEDRFFILMCGYVYSVLGYAVFLTYFLIEKGLI